MGHPDLIDSTRQSQHHLMVQVKDVDGARGRRDPQWTSGVRLRLDARAGSYRRDRWWPSWLIRA